VLSGVLPVLQAEKTLKKTKAPNPLRPGLRNPMGGFQWKYHLSIF
jgi:hypothetical protein